MREVPTPGAKHGKAANEIAFRLTGTRQGHVFATDTFVRVPTRSDPQRVYGADVAFVPFSILPRDADIPDGVLPVTPPLVVEVESPSDTWTSVFEKVEDYLGAGSASGPRRPDPTTFTPSAANAWRSRGRCRWCPR